MDTDSCAASVLKGLQIGAHSVRETPVPIPNTAVKPRSGYYTWPIKAWENSTVPYYKKDFLNGSLFFIRKLGWVSLSLREMDPISLAISS